MTSLSSITAVGAVMTCVGCERRVSNAMDGIRYIVLKESAKKPMLSIWVM